jgi:Transcriptional regulator
MGRNPEKDARELAARKQRILENAFRVFSERTIEKVSMNEVADACGMGVATVYRHYGTKQELVLAISTAMWKTFLREKDSPAERGEKTAAEEFARYLDHFLDLYRNRKDLLRFNQFFNVYVQSEEIAPEQMESYMTLIGRLADRFHSTYEKGRRDGTLRTDLPEKEMFSSTLHLMLAAVTRYAVGLVYNDGTDPEQELLLLKRMLLREFTAGG